MAKQAHHHHGCIAGLAGAAVAGGATALTVAYVVRRLYEKRQAVSGVGRPLPYVAQGHVYLDWNATSPIFPEVTACIAPFVSTEFGNPSSDHCFGAPSRRAVSKARGQVAVLLGCAPEEIVFCGCGTEADNMAIRSGVELGRGRLPPGAVPHVVTSCIEHPAVTVCLRALAKAGLADVTQLPVDSEGRVDPLAAAAAVKETTVLVTIMHSNNEVGTVQDIQLISEAVKKAAKRFNRPGGILVHTDAAQSVGKVAVRPKELGADLATVVGHKFGAPKGIAALYVRKGVPLAPMLHGGGQESGRRAGTEAVSQIVALGAASEVVSRELAGIAAHMRRLVYRLHRLLAEGLGANHVRVNGPPLDASDSERLPNTLSVGIRGASAGRVLSDLSAANIAASASAACHAADVAEAQVSFVLQAMAVPSEFGLGTLRLSVGRHTTPQEVDRAAAEIVASVTRAETAAAKGDDQ